ncbi:hypothetical protein L1276_001964 [Flavobacterium sp. HSC-32F16]|uniref:porin family protein n=1 Tax=Flavobacterium sp. HSC-32F16 TaxID=2910964 RepID=UPI0020A542CF|nr:porin family protein [Flavobacterium sp. HSC-32F16]MCP2026820.1 hypothetical protein [Flavobacterium sp. HSC-32F16]
MENKTEIGKAIKNKLLHLDQAPGDFVWSRIEEDLNKKRRRRFLIWLIPSILLMGLLSTVAVLNNKNQNEISGTQKTPIHLLQNQTVQQSTGPKKKTEKKEPNNNDTVLIRKSKNVKLIKQSSKLVSSTNEYEEYEVTKKYKITIKKEKIHIKDTPKINPTKTNKASKSLPVKKKYYGTTVSSKTKPKPFKGKKSPSKITKQKTETELPKTNVVPVIPETVEPKITETIPVITEEKKDSIPVIDSVPVKKKRVPKIKENTPEKIVVNNPPERRVHIYYGPAVFSSLNNKSLIDPSLSKQPTSKPVTAFYGVYIKIMYRKTGFRVGFSHLSLKTSTLLDQNELIPSYSNIELKTNLSPAIINNTFANSTDVELTQTLSYYELPIEFNYAVKKDKSRFNIEAFGGLSTMLLKTNTLEMRSDEVLSQNIGSSRNISKVNIASNIGLGFSYELTKKLQLEINPLFKYYFNTFKDDNDAKPYSLSLQSGLSYKF